MVSLQAELQRFIARLKIAEEDSRTMRRDLVALRQNMRDAWAGAGGRTLLAAFSGEVDGCTSHAFPGASVAVKDHASGVTLGTGTCDANGKYEVWANLDTDPQSLDVVASPTGTFAARFAASATQNVPSAHAGGNAVATVVIPPAANFVCGPTNYYPDATCPKTVILTHPSGCPARGATVDFIEGGVTVFSGTTNSSGAVVYPGAMTTGSYTINWTFAGLTGSVNSTGCATVNITTALPTGYTQNCPDAMPTLFITDKAGTRQIYPTRECVVFTFSPGITGPMDTGLIATGSCGSPSKTWLLVTSVYPNGTSCPGITPVGIFNENITMSCTRPMSLSGNYTSGPFTGGGGPSAFMIHE